MGQQAKQWILANPPKKDAVLDDSADATFKFQTIDLPDLGDNQVLLKVNYLSNDPAQRGWIQSGVDPERLYTEPVKQGEVMRAFGVCEVVESKSDKIKKGQAVIATTGWTNYAVMKDSEVRPVQPDESAGIKPTHFIGSLGGPGLTAYYGLIDIVGTTKDDAVVVSGAAGATGSMVVQIAKHIVGCKKIIGIAGGEKKCRWVESLGADICVDYKSPTFKEDLWKATDGFVEVYFDNVGGEILDMALAQAKPFARFVQCGAISEYNKEKPDGIKNYTIIIAMRIRMQGFIVLDYRERYGEARKQLAQWLSEGKLKRKETVVKGGLSQAESALLGLFKGQNTGKMMVEVAKPEEAGAKL